ncbi:hypothetical protein [Acinetobacter seifertii]|uniref:hypothetical protein n=1 Tax=Acinetobacter seifertii TaxID=1530123 RepID=UPI000C226801|nr:hypothetical protein [Acinetobacter seifertii]PJG66777.1 hypothetical protein CVD09_09685 [Acinetobacter seifertii]
MSVGFTQAIDIAKENAKELLPKASSFDLEGIVLNNDNDYEVTLSYIIDYSDKLKEKNQDGGIGIIMAALARKREEKIFIVTQSGIFKGFRNIK